MPTMRRRFWHALIAFLVLPGTVAFLGPWLLRPVTRDVHIPGVPVFVAGIVLLLWCVRDFYVVGRGSLAPWAPPERLVIVGLYRLSRNPMYIAVLVILCGWATMYASRTLWLYTVFVAIAFHLRVIFGEEPWLARTHGAEWTAYRADIPRWLGIPMHPRLTDNRIGILTTATVVLAAALSFVVGSVAVELSNSSPPGLDRFINDWLLNVLPSFMFGAVLASAVAIAGHRAGTRGSGTRAHVRRMRWGYGIAILLSIAVLASAPWNDDFRLFGQLLVWPLSAVAGCLLADLVVGRRRPTAET
jgi:protein-S-isoprenylcysteine O-methyltransferase Ste14